MDNSFLRFVKNDFAKAKLNENFLNTGIVNDRFIQMLPNDVFEQITNSSEDIAFGGNLTAELIDCSENVKFTLELGLNLFINEFTDINGIRQIAFAFGLIGRDFGATKIFLRLKHNVSDKIWYSSPFYITNFLKEDTTFFQYKNESYFRGISYDVENIYQTIRLACFDNDIDAQIDDSEYIELSGNRISYRTTITEINKGLFKYCNNFNFKRAVTLFNHDFIYINGFRCNDKPKLKKGDRLDTSNFFQLSYEYNPTEEFKAVEYQIFRGLEVINREPIDGSVLDTTDGLFSLTFNKEINLVAGINVKLYENGILVSTKTPTKLFNILNVNFSDYTFSNKRYDLVIEANKIYSNANEYFLGYNYGQWKFNILPSFILSNVEILPIPPTSKKLRFTFSYGGTLSSISAELGDDEIFEFQEEIPLLGVTSTQSITIPDVLFYNKFRLKGIDSVTGLIIYSNIFTI